MGTKGDVLVVGGGVMGLSIAYNLLKSGVKTILLEGEYLNAGNTGRNMGVLKVRIPEAIEKGDKNLLNLAKNGLKQYQSLSSETGINIFFRRGGCLTVAKTEEENENLKKQHEKLVKLGGHEELLSSREISRRWSYINANSLVGGAYCAEEAMVHPFGVTWAFVESIKRLKGKLLKLDRVKQIKREGNHFEASTDMGELTANKVVIAADGESTALVENLGHNLPLKGVQKEMIISEAMRPFFGPTVERTTTGYQIAQTMRGEIMGTMGEQPPSQEKFGVTSNFLNEFANETVPMIPAMKNLRIIRQWAGVLNKTPDGKPAVGALEDNLYITCGFNDYGLTLAPSIGKLLAAEINGGDKSPLIKLYDPKRFN